MCFAPGLVKNTLGPSGIRTRDVLITSRMLYQLSYRPLDCQTAEIFLSTQLIGGHGGVVLLVMFSYLSVNTWPWSLWPLPYCYCRSEGQLMWKLYLNDLRCVPLASQQAQGRQQSANDRVRAKVEIPSLTVNPPVNGDTQCVLHQDWWKTHWARAEFEPVTSRLQVGCSTNWATGHSTVRQLRFSCQPNW